MNMSIIQIKTLFETFFAIVNLHERIVIHFEESNRNVL
jgi:hypothetical protein